MINVKVKESDGRLLDYLFALSLGWCWVKNASRRSGDSYCAPGEGPSWPIDHRCFVGPSKLKDISKDNKNWDGWLISNYHEPIAKAAFYDLPKWPIHKCKECLDVAESYDMSIQGSSSIKGKWRARISQSGLNTTQYGDSMVQAIMRCAVARKMGKSVAVDSDICDYILKTIY